MEIVNFTPISSFLGGLIIGVTTSAMLYTVGRLLGVSGIVKGCVVPTVELFGGNLKGLKDNLWRFCFVIGLVIGGWTISWYMPENTILGAVMPIYYVLAIAGFLVGYGTALGHGCTSGHGICGIARRSKRSFVATSMFMLSGFITVYIFRHIFGII